MTADQQILSIHGQGETICQRLNYFTDPRFSGMIDANPLHEAAKTATFRSKKESSRKREIQSEAR